MGVDDFVKLLDFRIEYTEQTIEAYRQGGIETFACQMVLDELVWLRSMIRMEEKNDND